MADTQADAVLYAPNVHTGGGFVLLRGLLADWPEGRGRTAFLDERARGRLAVPANVNAHWVAPRAGARLAAERHLQRVSAAGGTVLCFHSLPPLLPNRARVVVYQQNRNLLGLNPLSDFALRTAARLAIERSMARRMRHRVAEYIVQTPTMARELQRWYGPDCPPVRVLPFVEDFSERLADVFPAWDFVFVADGEAMKNHARLLDAWVILAEQGLRPSLALTLGPRDTALAERIAALSATHDLQVRNLGHLPRAEVLMLYASARALVFPSISESFGLPLIEAAHLGLPIVAAELDYVRDVCVPAQTFDPLSAVSMARAVRRLLGDAQAPQAIAAPAALWKALAA